MKGIDLKRYGISIQRFRQLVLYSGFTIKRISQTSNSLRIDLQSINENNITYKKVWSSFGELYNPDKHKKIQCLCKYSRK